MSTVIIRVRNNGGFSMQRLDSPQFSYRFGLFDYRSEVTKIAKQVARNPYRWHFGRSREDEGRVVGYVINNRITYTDKGAVKNALV